MQHRIFKQVPRIIFGQGSLARLRELTPPKSQPSDYYVFVVDDVLKATPVAERINSDPGDVVIWFEASKKEPSTKQVDAYRDRLKQERKELPRAVVGIGGGATMDVAKAISVMLTNPGSATEYQGWDLVKVPGIFKVGVPTLSGSGSEASRTAVLMGIDRKFGINSDYSMFDAIVLDSSLTEGVPRDQRFYTAMDCFIHCVESLSGTMINDLARAYANRGLELCREVYLGKGSPDELMVASYMGGCSIVNSEVGVCHALSYGLSLELGFRHGFANCVVFDVLEEYYGEYVTEFRDMLARHRITLPKGVTKPLDAAALDRMIKMTLRMERPLINALGDAWREKLVPAKIAELYARM